MDATPGLNQRLIATTSILVALFLIGVLLVGAVMSLFAAIEGVDAPTGASGSIETPIFAPPMAEAPESTAPTQNALAEESRQEWPIEDKGILFTATSEPTSQLQANDFPFAPDAPPEYEAPGSPFPETPCCFADGQTTAPALANSAPIVDEQGAVLPDSGPLGAAPTHVSPMDDEEAPFTPGPEEPWLSQSTQLRFPPDSPPTSGPPKFSFPGTACVLAGQSTTSPQATDAAAMIDPDAVLLSNQRVYVPPPDQVFYAQAEEAPYMVDGEAPWQNTGRDPPLPYDAPPGSVFPETPCSFGDEPATASEPPYESPEVAFPASQDDSVGQPTTPLPMVDTAVAEPPSQLQPQMQPNLQPPASASPAPVYASAGQPTTPDWAANAAADPPPVQTQPQLPAEPQALPLQEETSGAEGAKGDATGATDEKQTLGEAPKETKTELQFLRRQSILLDPGEYQIDVTCQYLIDEADYALARIVGNTLQIGEAKRRQRLFLVPIELRVGIDTVTQAFVNLPVGWSNSEFSFGGQERMEETTGLGDISAGFTKLFVEKTESRPDVLGTFAFSAPTGEADFATSLWTPGSSLGSGYWSLTAALTFIRTYDPMVLFYGGGYSHRFEHTFDGGISVDPGEQIFLRMGAGFAVNPRVTLSASLTRSYLGADVVNGVQVPGGIREPTTIRLAATIAQGKKAKGHDSVRTVEPFINFGITEDAIDSLIGISWTR